MRYQETEEIWVDIEGYEHFYQVSNLGNVKSIDRNVLSSGIIRRRKGRVLQIWKNHGGYNMVTLSKEGKHNGKAIAIMVAKKFVPNPLNLPEVNHKDGDKDNNAASNLEWNTRLQNQQHAVYTLGKHHAGENHYKAKLTCDQVLEMRRLFSTGKYSKTEIGKMFGVQKDHAINIINNKCWKTLKRA